MSTPDTLARLRAIHALYCAAVFEAEAANMDPASAASRDELIERVVDLGGAADAIRFAAATWRVYPKMGAAVDQIRASATRESVSPRRRAWLLAVADDVDARLALDFGDGDRLEAIPLPASPPREQPATVEAT